MAHLPSPTRIFAVRNRMYCDTHLRQVYALLVQYAEAHGELFPDSLATLAQNELTHGHPIDKFTCPALQPLGYLSTPTAQAVLSEIASKTPAYVYVAKGLRCNYDSHAPLIYDQPINHTSPLRGGTGIHVLYADGRVEWLDEQLARRFLNGVSAESNPSRSP